MIDQNFFSGEASKLIAQYGDKAMSGHRLGLIYKAIRKLDPEELVYIVDDIIGNSKFAPTLDDFRDKARRYLANKANNNQVECSICSSSGLVSVNWIDGRLGGMAFSCTCQNGLAYSSIQKWSDSQRKYFTRQPVPIALTHKYYGTNKNKQDDTKEVSGDFAKELNELMKKYII